MPDRYHERGTKSLMNELLNTVDRVGRHHGYDWDAAEQDSTKSFHQFQEPVAKRVEMTEAQKRRSKWANRVWACVFYALVVAVVALACHEMGVGPQ